MAARDLNYFKDKADPKTGLVAMTLLKSITPHMKGDVAGFTPDDALFMEQNKQATSDLDSTDAQDARDDEFGPGNPDPRDNVTISPTWSVWPAARKMKLASEIKKVDISEIGTIEDAEKIIQEEVDRRDVEVRAQQTHLQSGPVGVATFNDGETSDGVKPNYGRGGQGSGAAKAKAASKEPASPKTPVAS